MTTEAHVLSESLGDYLESVYLLARENGVARVKDVAGRLNVRMSSVTSAMRALCERDMVDYGPYKLITLTPRGKKIAKDLARRHEVLTRFFHEVIGLRSDAAERNACHVEHAIEPAALQGFVAFLERERPAVRKEAAK